MSEVSTDDVVPLHFVSEDHALHTGLFLGLLLRWVAMDRNVMVSPEVDENGTYLNRVHIAVGEDEYTFTLAVLPEVDEST